MPRRLIRPNLDTLTVVFYNGYWAISVFIINYLRVKFATFSLAKVVPYFIVVFTLFWSYYGRYGYLKVLSR